MRLITRAFAFMTWGVATALAMQFFIHSAVPFATDISPDRYGGMWPRRTWLLAHIAAGGLALLAGLFQLASGPWRRWRGMHRWTGRLYVAAVALGGGSAFYLAAQTDRALAYRLSLGAMGLAWWATTGPAYFAIRRGRITEHREWALRSYVVTFAFVTFRWWAERGVLPSLGSEPVALLILLSWSVPLLITEAIIQTQRALSRRSRAVRAVRL